MTTIREAMEKLCIRYPEDSRYVWNHEKESFQLVQYELPELIRGFLDELGMGSFVVKGQSGNSGNWNKVPSIAIMDPDICKMDNGKPSMKKGVYPVYLLSTVENCIYFILVQATFEADIGKLKENAESVRNELGTFDFQSDTQSIIFPDDKRNYSKAAIVYKRYDYDNIPEESILKEDLRKMMEIYSEYKERLYVSDVADADNGFWPSIDEYNPGLTVDDWKNYFANNDDVDALRMLKGIMLLGGQASCTKMASVYGGDYNLYNGTLTGFGTTVLKRFGIEPYSNNGVQSVIFALIQGKDLEEDGLNGKHFVWRIRPELKEALDAMDLSQYDPYFDPSMNDPSQNQPQVLGILESYTSSDFLREVFMSEQRYNDLVGLLRNKKNIILQGAPGVGKTFTAKRLAYSMMGVIDDSRVEFIQFHQNYSYEDFILGFKPSDSGFNLTEGVFFRFCRKATEDPSREYFFIIDEINRGNMSKIFGELLMLIERDYRGESATLAYNGERFSVPKNLYLIGMMNTADRSLALIDYALRRRFCFFEIEPGFDSEGFARYQKDIGDSRFDALVDIIRELNIEISGDDSLGNGFRIGHSHLLCSTGYSRDWLREVVKYDLIPTLAEYWFDDRKKVEQWSMRLNGVLDD